MALLKRFSDSGNTGNPPPKEPVNSGGGSEMTRPAPPVQPPSAPRPGMSPSIGSQEGLTEFKNRVQMKLLSSLEPTTDMTRKEQLRQNIERVIDEMILEEHITISRPEKIRLYESVCAELLGFGPLDSLLDDDAITEIMVNGATHIYVEKRGKIDPQLLNPAPVGVLMNIPVGSVSEKATPVKAVDGFGFVMVNTNGVVPPMGMGSMVKSFEIAGGETTFKVAEAVFPVPPLVEVTGSLVFMWEPPVDEVTLTTTLQLLPIASEPPVNVMEFAVLVTVPLHCTALGTLAIVIPPGKVSVNPTPVNAIVLAAGFDNVNVSVEFWPAAIVDGENTLLIATNRQKG